MRIKASLVGIPELDGLRAVAVLGVVMVHVYVSDARPICDG